MAGEATRADVRRHRRGNRDGQSCGRAKRERDILRAVKIGRHFSTSALRAGGRARQQRFAKFLKHYELAKDVERYVREGVKGWKGKSVEIVPYKRGAVSTCRRG